LGKKKNLIQKELIKAKQKLEFRELADLTRKITARETWTESSKKSKVLSENVCDVLENQAQRLFFN
jgi:hypothetical protein